jgi:hypothetical protein
MPSSRWLHNLVVVGMKRSSYDCRSQRRPHEDSLNDHGFSFDAALEPRSETEMESRNDPDPSPRLIRNLLKSKGYALAPAVCRRMQAYFKYDFSKVRVHSGEHATTAARLLNARAFTIGSHIVFGRGNYSPETPKGLWLLAHELVHVMQQQAGRLQAEVGHSADFEQQACRTADLLIAGTSLPPDFAIKPGYFGAFQCHQDEPCPGRQVSAGAKEIYLPANQAIEIAYRNDPRNVGHSDSIFFGSEWDSAGSRDVLPPRGVTDKKFATALLQNLRGLVRQRRPDIIDFQLRVLYEIKTTGFVASGNVQKESYYIVTQTLMEGGHRMPPWQDYAATWYPPHVLPLPGDLTGRLIVCTEATDHKRWPGLILYEVHELGDDETKKRRMRQAIQFRDSGYDRAFSDLRPMIDKELKRAVRLYDPNRPEYVIIVPQKYYQVRWAQQTERDWDTLRITHRYDFAGGEAVRNLKGKIFAAECLVAFIGGAAAVAGGVAVVAVGATAIGATAAASSVVSAEAVTAGAAAGSVGADIISLTAYRAALAAAPQAKALAAAAGVLILLGSVTRASASSPSVNNVSAIRAVPVSDFLHRSGVWSTSSNRSMGGPGFGSGSAGFPKGLGLGDRVMFDGESYFVISLFTAV